MKEKSIEEDIEYVKDVIALAKALPIGEIKIQEKEIETVEHILSDYKRVLKENEELKEYIAIAPNLDEMTAVKYRNIQQDAYIKGRTEEQQRAEQIIYENYIPVQKVKDKIEEIDERIKNPEKISYWASYTISECIGIRRILQELLEERK